MKTRQEMLARLGQLENMRCDRVAQAGVEQEEDLPDDAEGRAISAEWNAIVATLNNRQQ
jgi:hypothetical protein